MNQTTPHFIYSENTSGNCFQFTPPKLKFTSLKFNLTPLLVPKCEVYSRLVGILLSYMCAFSELCACPVLLFITRMYLQYNA